MTVNSIEIMKQIRPNMLLLELEKLQQTLIFFCLNLCIEKMYVILEILQFGFEGVDKGKILPIFEILHIKLIEGND